MKKNIFVVIIMLILITGCGKKKETLKYIELDENKGINVITKLDKSNKELFIETRGFKNSPGYVIIEKDKEDKILSYDTNPEIYDIGKIKDNNKYYKVRFREFNVKFSDDIKINKKKINYECLMRIEIINPLTISEINKNISIEDFFNIYLKELIKNEFNDSIKNRIEKSNNEEYIDYNSINNDFNALIQSKTENEGYKITIFNFRIMNESNKNY